MNQLQVFQNSEFGEIGVLIIDGKEYFPATACAKTLGYENPRKAVRDHCKGGTKRSVGVRTGTRSDGNAAIQVVEKTFIPEGDLYRLIIRSRLPAAERFERWIFDDVLPELRRTGSYISRATSSGPAPDIQVVIAQAVTAAVGETVRQLLPILRDATGEWQRDEWTEEPAPARRQRRPQASIIHRLDDVLRREVEDMIADERNYSYREICEMLRAHGVMVSQMTVCRYAKNMNKIY